MKFRIRGTQMGYVVEVQKYKWYGFIKYWTHYISVFGFYNEPWYFMTYEHALEELSLQVQKETIINSKKNNQI
jgi:hypothetical protein